MGQATFVIFRASAANHPDWGIAIPSRVEGWHYIAFAWNEAHGVRLFWDATQVAAKKQATDLDMALEKFGLADAGST